MASIVSNKEFSTIVTNATDVIKTISKDFGSGVKTLEDTSGADYKPPTGRRFIIQSVFWTASDTSAGNITISQGSVVDTMGSTMQDLRFAGETSGTYPLFAEVTTGNYVTCQGSAGHMSCSITGVETDN